MTRRRILAWLFGSVSILTIGCAVQGSPFEKVTSPPTTAVIYVYRPYSYFSSALKPAVTCGEDTARIGPGGYHAFVVPARQKVICSVNSETYDEVEIRTDAKVYYIKEEFSWGVLSGHSILNPKDNDEAQKEIQTCCVQEQQEPQP